MEITSKSKVLIIGYPAFTIRRGKVIHAGGSELVTHELLTLFSSLGANITYLVQNLTNYKNLAEYDSKYNCKSLEFKKDMSVLRTCLESDDYDLIINSTGAIAHFERKYIKEILTKVDIPVVYYNHSVKYCDIETYGSLILNSSNSYVISIIKEDYLRCRAFGIPEDRLFKLNNFSNLSVDVEDLVEVPEVKLLICSRVDYGKGLAESLELANKLGLRVSLCGPINRRSLYSSLVESYKFDYLGVLSREEVVREFLANSFVLFLPDPNIESMTLTVLESMSVGTPIITWNDSSIREYVSPEYNILLDRTDDYIDQFESDYLNKLSNYTSLANKSKLMKDTSDKYGISAYRNNLISIIDRI